MNTVIEVDELYEKNRTNDGRLSWAFPHQYFYCPSLFVHSRSCLGYTASARFLMMHFFLDALYQKNVMLNFNWNFVFGWKSPKRMYSYSVLKKIFAHLWLKHFFLNLQDFLIENSSNLKWKWLKNPCGPNIIFIH